MAAPVILFGAFDRHNLGDLLMAHVAAALLPGRALHFAGLADRDLRAFGGHEVMALHRLAASAVGAPCTLLHVGGEILSCDAWQAAVMLLPPQAVQPTVAYLEERPDERREWVRRVLGTPALAPYVASRQDVPGVARVVFNAVGGVGLDRADPALRTEVLAKLRAADELSVRDRQTFALLAAAGVPARLLPDPAVMVGELFGARIARHADLGEVAELRRAFPQGYLAVQFSADFGDDASLHQIATQLDRVCGRTGLGVVLFRAGAAPWHDDADALGRVAALMPPGTARCFTSLDIWDLCALIASSRGFCGSSLHGRIVASAFGLPRLNLRPPVAAARTGKQAAYAATWDDSAAPAEVDLPDLADGLQAALAVPPAALRQQAQRLAALYRQGFRPDGGP
ncbi:MAG: polysaccharide pyruvyl transferase family protein [Rubrivivax sp.]|nr:polysaccharide pyruvyl transferase family protein [Rubrivivax sp.]